MYSRDNPKRGELILRGLPVEQGQEVEVLLLFNPLSETKKGKFTAQDLLQSSLIGLWKEREDIADSVIYARQLREASQMRDVIRERLEDDHS